MFHIRNQPPLGSTIDFGDRLSRGLESCHIFNQRSGNKSYDLINPSQDLIFTGSTSPYFQLNGVHTVLNGFLKAEKDSLILGKTSLSMTVGFYYPAIPANIQYIICVSNVAGQLIFVLYATDINGYIGTLLASNSGTSDNPILPITRLVANTFNIFTIQWDLANIKVYRNGVYLGLLARAGATISTTSSYLQLGNRYDEARDFVGDYYFLYQHNRLLTDDEIFVLHQNPYCIFDTGLVTNDYEAAPSGDPEGCLIAGKLIRGGLLTHGVLVRG